MKHTIITTLLLCMTYLTNAQITFNRSHLISAGQKIVQANHESRHAFASSGANQTWDFSDLKADYRDSLRFGLPDWYKGHENFPQANLAYINYDEDSTIYFMIATDTEVRFVGMYQYTDSSEGVMEYNSKLVGFPCTYNSAFTDNVSSVLYAFELGIDPDSTGPIPTIDSVRLKLNRTNKSLVDGWGSLKTPLGTFSALKQTTEEINKQVFEMKTGNTWMLIPKMVLDALGFPEISSDTNYSVNFWTNDASVGFPVMSYNYSKGEDSAASVNWTYRKAAASSLSNTDVLNTLVFPNPASATIQITGISADSRLEILNFEGKTVFNGTADEAGRLDISALSAGVYLLQVLDARSGQLLATEKIIKQ